MKFRFLVTYDVPTDCRNKHSIRPDDIADWQLAVEQVARYLIPTAEGSVWVERFEEEMDWRKAEIFAWRTQPDFRFSALGTTRCCVCALCGVRGRCSRLLPVEKIGDFT